jgi:hypothetical protein
VHQRQWRRRWRRPGAFSLTHTRVCTLHMCIHIHICIYSKYIHTYVHICI